MYYKGYRISMCENNTTEIIDNEEVLQKGYYCQVYLENDYSYEIDNFCIVEGRDVISIDNENEIDKYIREYIEYEGLDDYIKKVRGYHYWYDDTYTHPNFNVVLFGKGEQVAEFNISNTNNKSKLEDLIIKKIEELQLPDISEIVINENNANC